MTNNEIRPAATARQRGEKMPEGRNPKRGSEGFGNALSAAKTRRNAEKTAEWVPPYCNGLNCSRAAMKSRAAMERGHSYPQQGGAGGQALKVPEPQCVCALPRTGMSALPFGCGFAAPCSSHLRGFFGSEL